MRINTMLMVGLMTAALAFIAVNDRAQAMDITQTTTGTYRGTGNNAIQIKENTGGEKQIAVDSNTVYTGVQKLADLKTGDEVQVDYKINHNKKIAVTITKIEGGE